MGIAYKCDITGQYADTMDNQRSYEFTKVHQGKTFKIRLMVQILDQTNNPIYAVPAVWTAVSDEIKARI